MERISVAIASYNGGRFIAEQLHSILDQTCLPHEIVISDDGSRDDTISIVEAIAARAPIPIRILRQPVQLGILENFYAAFQGCSGDLIAYCDQDDVWRPDKLALQLEMIRKGAVLVMHPSLIVDEDLNRIGDPAPANAKHGLLDAPVDTTTTRGYGHQMLFTRTVLNMMVALRSVAETHGTTSIASNFDRFIPFCASTEGRIAILDQPLTFFRRHTAATSGAGTWKGGTETIRQRARTAIERDCARAADSATILQAAIDGGHVNPAVGRPLVKAYQHKLRLAQSQSRIMDARTPVSKWTAWVRAVIVAIGPSGFTNGRRLHAIRVSTAAALG